MSALGRKVLDLAEQQGLLDGKAVAELRRQVAESKFVITPEAIAKVLVDHGHLTPFQARKLVSQALGNEPDPVEQRVAEKAKPKPKPKPEEELTFADPADRPKPVAREPEIEDLEIIDADPKPARPTGKKPVSKPAIPAERSPKENSPASLKQPVEGSTADDFVELKEIDAAPPTRGNRWKTDPPGAELAETIELTPIDLSTPSPAADLVPIDDLFGPDPVAAPAPRKAGAKPLAVEPLSSADLLTPLPPLASIPRPGKNVWDSPLMLIGGGALGVILVLFALLFYALTRGTAAEMFSKAEDEYSAGSYSSAIALYETFLQKYPSDPSASLARVRLGMATLRQVTDDRKNPRLGLDTAKQVLPEIETEEKFGEARSELATILPDVADGFATQASQTQDSAKKGELVKLAGDALALVNNPAYLPASLRKDREGHIGRIVDKLKAAERSIQQDQDLAGTITKIAAAAEQGNAAAAYSLQADLLRTYPALAGSAPLIAAVKKVGEKERQLVKTSDGGPEPFKNDHPPGSDRVPIAFREEGAPTAANTSPVFVLVEGAVYGLDAQSGRILWRRFVGYETTNQPLALAGEGAPDAVLIDGRRHELVRVKGSTGELVWRQKLSGDAAGPVIIGSRVLVATRKGSLIAVDAATGQIAASAQLPQGAEVAPAARQSRIFQLGEHSTLFVLDANSLACTETIYLGHRAGEVLVPPVAVLDQLLVIKSPADDYSEIQVLSPDASTKRLSPFGKPQRLKGRIVTPLSVSAARVAAITDLGQIAVFEVDPAGAPERLRLIAGLANTETTPRHAFCELERNATGQPLRLWVASHRREMFEVQSTILQLARRWTENHDDTFLAPLRLQGDVLVQVRRRSGVAAVLIQGCRATSGEPLWTTHLAAPLVALVASESRQTVDALTADGRLTSLRNEQFAAHQIQQPPVPPKSGAAIFPAASPSADGQTLVWTESQAPGRVHTYDTKSGGSPVTHSLPARAIAPAAAFGAGVVAPLANGTAVLVARDSAESKVAPFMPPLVPDALPLWTMPLSLADGKTFLISDGRGALYSVTKRDGPQSSLAEVGKTQTNDPVVSPLVLAGSTAFGVMRQQSTDAVAGFDARGAPAFEPVPLEGRVQAGPYGVGGLVFVAAEPDGLVCFSADGRVRWQQPPDRGILAGPPLACPDGDVLVAYQSGLVCRLDPATGNALAQHDVGEPLSGPACLVGSHAFVAGSDGVVHRIPVPPRP